MSQFNPTACVFPHLGNRQREVLLKMCDGWRISCHSFDDGDGDCNTLLNPDEDVAELLTNDFIKRFLRFKDALRVFSWSPSLGHHVMDIWIKPSLCEETKLLLQ